MRNPQRGQSHNQLTLIYRGLSSNRLSKQVNFSHHAPPFIEVTAYGGLHSSVVGGSTRKKLTALVAGSVSEAVPFWHLLCVHRREGRSDRISARICIRAIAVCCWMLGAVDKKKNKEGLRESIHIPANRTPLELSRGSSRQTELCDS